MEQVEHALLYTFLEASSDCKFKEQLHSLRSQGTLFNQGRYGPFVPHSFYSLPYEDDSELQCDGNRSGHLQNGEIGFGAPVNEDVIRLIAAHLAEIGDKLDRDVQTRVVNDLAQHFLNENLSREEIMRQMSRVVRELAQAAPSDMEQEKVMLVLTMILVKKIGNTVPSLLQRVWNTAVNFINQQFHDYIVEMLGE